MSISIDDLKLGSLYLWSPAPKDYRTWVGFFHVSDGAVEAAEAEWFNS